MMGDLTLSLGQLTSLGSGIFHNVKMIVTDACCSGEVLARVADTNTDGVPDFLSTTYLDGFDFLLTSISWFSQIAAEPYQRVGLQNLREGFISTGVAPDLNNDGFKDIAFALSATDSGKLVHLLDTELQSSPVSYASFQQYALQLPIYETVSADFDGDGRADLVGIGDTTLTVALNHTRIARCSAPNGSVRLINMCLTLSSNNLKVQANNSDNWNVNATKIYIDGNPTAAFFTTDDLLTHNFELAPGIHSVTVKMWDQNGPFSSSKKITVPNSACSPLATDRTVHICAPVANASLRETLRVQAAVRDSKTVTAVKIYLDGPRDSLARRKQSMRSSTHRYRRVFIRSP